MAFQLWNPNPLTHTLTLNTYGKVTLTLTWQAAFRLRKALLLFGAARRAALEDEQLRSLWGSVQLGWYGTDVDGRIVPHAADLPLLRDESESESDEQ